MSDIPEEIRRAGRGAVDMYARLLSEGYGHRWAEMCALQQPPGTAGCDRTYMEGRYNNQQLDEMPRDHARLIAHQARKAGISISGKYYAASLADKRGPADPGAWVDSTADVKRVAQLRNYSVEGAVKHRGIQEAPRRKALSERLVKEMMTRERASNPKLKDPELREHVVAKYAYKGGKQ